jgi:glycosyltransferase involved in cell wall biosynthesis
LVASPNWRFTGVSAIRLKMLSVLIETRNAEEGLARTLASLVGGAVEGVVREVIVCDLGSTDQTHRVAEHAGCHYLANGGVSAGIRLAKGEWLLLLEPGARLAGGWVDEVVAHAAKSGSAARFSAAKGSKGPLVARLLGRRRALARGILITKGKALALSQKAGNAEAIARATTPKRLNAEIWVAPEQ